MLQFLKLLYDKECDNKIINQDLGSELSGFLDRCHGKNGFSWFLIFEEG